MAEDNKIFPWTTKLDWLNILSMLNLESISQIPEFKKDRAIKRLNKFYGIEVLMEFEPSYLDKLVVNEFKDLMKKELLQNAREQERMKKKLRNNIVPMKRGGIIRIDPREFKDLKDLDGDPEKMLKYFYKKFLGKDDDDKDDDKDKYGEDNTGYYI
ncbi:MAG: hypothetical protein KAT57_06280 [Candidatus Lokiarchaeota archaeon]|nr:hypothetical protein [Candidatus Lokiarchaeota archaeon]TKJ23595.1 MAG: hypothetical protein CEE43_02740 [Candidatus Lokiarchaeota archaeon Loki_b32]